MFKIDINLGVDLVKNNSAFFVVSATLCKTNLVLCVRFLNKKFFTFLSVSTRVNPWLIIFWC